jgi:DNA polymerase-1
MNGGAASYFDLLDRLLGPGGAGGVPVAASSVADAPSVSVGPDNRAGGPERHTAVAASAMSPTFRSSYVTDPSTLEAAIVQLRSQAILGVDLETECAGPSASESSALDPHTGKVRLVTIATEASDGVTEVVVIDGQRCPDWGVMLKPLFESAGTTLVAHNAKFEVAWLLKHAITPAAVSDTLLASQILDGGEHFGQKGYFSLSSVAERELGWNLDKTLQTSDWGAAELSVEQLDYAAKDAVAALLVHRHLRERLDAEQLTEIADLENRVLPALAWMELSGAPFDARHWADLSDGAMGRKLRLAAEIAALISREINLDSPKQVRAALGELGILVESTAEEVLVTLVDRHPVVPKVLEYREASKLARTYGLEFVHHVNPITGRIHANYRQIGAATGRMSCSKPNLQQVPRDTAYRACFRPAQGRVLVKADLALVELCVAAKLSGDERMIEAITERQDLHRLTAAALFGKVPEDVTANERAFGKAVNFGTLFGQGRRGLIALALRHGLTLSEEDARRFQRRFAQAWPQLAAWQRRQMVGTEATLRTASGRIRRLANGTPGTVRANTPIQGTAADAFKAALALLYETRHRHPSAVLVLCVHDEIVVECDADEAEGVRDWLVDCMTQGMRTVLTRVPVVVEATIAQDWAGTPLPAPERAERVGTTPSAAPLLLVTPEPGPAGTSCDKEPQDYLFSAMPVSPAQAIAAILEICFPDAATTLDASYGKGNFWDGSAPVSVLGLDLNPRRAKDVVGDFCHLPFRDASVDVVVLDPPFLSDGGEQSVMRRQYTTFESIPAARESFQQAVREAWRVARIGIVVKAMDHIRGNQLLRQTDWVRAAVPVEQYEELLVPNEQDKVVDPKWKKPQLSFYRHHSAYLVFRKDGPVHKRRRPSPSRRAGG